MGGKPRPAKTAMQEHLATFSRAKLERLAYAAVRECDFALRCLDSGPGSGVRINLRTGESARWEEAFFDVLDLAGIKHDRAACYAHWDKKRRRRKP